jgi:hypothetical protein
MHGRAAPPARIRREVRVVILFLALLAATGALAKSSATFLTPCDCEGNHGIARWRAKTDPSEPPLNESEIHPITPAEMYEWKGPGGNLPTGAGRIPAEQQWYAMTGKLKKLRVEDDGDLHMVLGDPNGTNPFEVVVEIPLGERWCDLRRTVFSWTDASFPFSTGRKPFHLRQESIVTVIGKAFYDTDHSGTDSGNNQRSYDKKTAVWEIHPVMRLHVGALSVGAPVASPHPGLTPAAAGAPPSSGATPQATSTPEQFVTIIQPVAIRIPYGTVVLQPGQKLPVVSRGPGTVTIRYMNETYPIPSAATEAP